jgi:hypothetical protein
VSANNKFLAITLLSLTLISFPLLAGEFSAQIESAELIPQDGWYVLEAQLRPKLSKTAKEAIRSNIPLTWNLKIQLKQEHYFHDKTLLNISYRYKIRYHGLLNSYKLINESNNSEKKYTSLTDALEGLAQVRELKVIQISALQQHQPYKVAIKLDFDREQLPAHLRPVAYLRSEWDLSSAWYVWLLKN